MGDITLSTATRTNLLSLQRTESVIGRTQERLASGLKVNSAIDDALAFFKARNLNARASDLQSIKDDIGGSISTLTAAIQGLEAIESVLKQQKAIAQSSIAASESTTRQKLGSQFNELRSQVDNLFEDSSFNGVNLLKNTSTAFAAGGDSLTVKFNEAADSNAVNQLVISGLSTADFTSIIGNSVNVTAVGGANFFGSAGAGGVTVATAAIEAIDSALVTVRQVAQEFGTNSALLEIRREFTEDLINTLRGGASDLVNADLNEESANLLSAQTRQQLGVVSLSIAQQSEQSVLRLF